MQDMHLFSKTAGVVLLSELYGCFSPRVSICVLFEDVTNANFA